MATCERGFRSSCPIIQQRVSSNEREHGRISTGISKVETKFDELEVQYILRKLNSDADMLASQVAK